MEVNMINHTITKYEAPDGFVYDWVEPHFDNDGKEQHLYVKFLFLGKFDTIEAYHLVEDPRKGA